MRPSPGAEVVTASLHFRPFTTGALRAVTDQVTMVYSKSLIPEREPDGHDLDDVTHKRKDGTK